MSIFILCWCYSLNTWLVWVIHILAWDPKYFREIRGRRARGWWLRKYSKYSQLRVAHFFLEREEARMSRSLIGKWNGEDARFDHGDWKLWEPFRFLLSLFSILFPLFFLILLTLINSSHLNSSISSFLQKCTSLHFELHFYPHSIHLIRYKSPVQWPCHHIQPDPSARSKDSSLK